MSGLVGKGSRSFKKENVSDSSLPTLGIRNFLMAFQFSTAVAAGGSVTLADSATVAAAPAEMATNGFEQPTAPEITNAQLGTFRNNVTVTSNLNGVLIDRVSYNITNETITFDDGLVANEIITIKRGNEVTTGNRIVDARPLRASGTVDFSGIGSAPVVFQTGEGFRIAPSTTSTGGADNRQIGFVQVFVDGVLQARNVGNADESTTPMATQTGNYREVIVNTATNVPLAVQNGVTANAIQFNQFQPFSSMEGVIVISTNLIVDAPNNTGVLDQIDSVQAQVTNNDTELARIPTPVGATVADQLRVNAGATAYELFTPDSGGGGLLAIQEFTASGNYTIPMGAVALRVTAAGAGGAGRGIGAVEGSTDGGCGGASGQYGTSIVPLPGAGDGTGTLTVTIGTGGTGVAQQEGMDGGSTSIASNSITITTVTWGGGPAGDQFNAGSGVDPNPTNPNNFSQEGGGLNAFRTVLTVSSPISFGRVAGLPATNSNITGLGGGWGGNNGKATGGRGGNGNTGISGSNNTTTIGGGGGGGAGWVDGTDGNSVATETTGGNGGRGGMIIEALSILPT